MASIKNPEYILKTILLWRIGNDLCSKNNLSFTVLGFFVFRVKVFEFFIFHEQAQIWKPQL